MKTFLAAIFVLFACACAARAQDAWHPEFFSDSVPSSPGPAVSSPVPSPAPDPAQRSREARIERGAFQLGVGFEFVRFRSSPFYASLSGLHTSFAYFRKDWLGVEGSVVAAFGSSSLFNEPSRLLLYGAGPRIAWDRRTWQPWAHALAGGIHVYPQTASGINGFAVQLGGGVDYPWKPLVSLRVESDYVRSQLYSSGQNSFQLGAGLVFHF
jgi:hypothetical protein